MATYYASPTGSGTTCSLESPGSADYTIATKASSNGDVVYLRGGTYGPFNQIVFAKGITIMSYPGETAILTFGANHGLYANGAGADGAVLNNFKITTGGGATSVAIYDFGSDITVTDVTIDGWSGRPFHARDGAVSTMNRVLIANCVGSTVLADATTVWNYSQWRDSGSGTDPCIQSTNAAGVHTINNGEIMGGASSPTGLSVSNGTVTLNNTPVLPGKSTTTNTYTVARTGGTLTLNNSPVNGNMWRATSYGISGTVTQNNSTNNVYPYFRNDNAAILTLFAIDSNHSSDGTGPGGVGTSLDHYCNVAAANGVHISYFPDDCDHLFDDQKATILAQAQAGHDIGCESVSSTGLSQTNPFKVTYSGGGANPRYVVTYTSDTDATFALITDSGTDATFSIGKGQTYQLIGGTTAQVNSLVKAIDEEADWSVTLNYAAGEFDDVYSYCIAAGTSSVVGDTHVLMDTTKWYDVEVTQSMASITAITGVPVTSYMFSRYLYAADAKTLAKAAGATVAISGSMGVVQLSSISDIYQINNPHIYYVAYLKGDGSEAQVKANVRALAEAMRRYGLWVSIVLEEAAAITENELNWIITEMQAAGVMVKSFREARAWLDANATAAGDGFTYSSPTDDYRLNPQSSWINAGIDVGLTEDCVGNPIYALPDIGAYEYQPGILSYGWGANWRRRTIYDCFYVDSGLSLLYSSEPTWDILGLDHLAGATVSLLVDGVVHPDALVSSYGGVSLEFSGTTIHAGLPYTATYRSVNLEGGSRMGTAIGQIKRIIKVILNLYNTSGGQIGFNDDDLQDIQIPSWKAGVSLFTGDIPMAFPKGYDTEAYIQVTQADPLPMTILNVIPVFQVNEK